MNYSKDDAIMTKGLAALCMVILHLFCRIGKDVYGKPLLWISPGKPFIYLFGFFAEICVPLYSICAGYGRQLNIQNNKDRIKNRLVRIGNLLLNYWIILCLFSLLGVIFKTDQNIPGSLKDFFLNVILIKSYNGAWWYLKSYILFMLIPSKVIKFISDSVSLKSGIVLCILFQISNYFINKF